MIHIGVDPGNAGAIAVINTLTKEIQFFDTPTVQVKSGKKFKNHMDPHAASLILQAFDDGRYERLHFRNGLRYVDWNLRCLFDPLSIGASGDLEI